MIHGPGEPFTPCVCAHSDMAKPTRSSALMEKADATRRNPQQVGLSVETGMYGTEMEEHKDTAA